MLLIFDSIIIDSMDAEVAETVRIVETLSESSTGCAKRAIFVTTLANRSALAILTKCFFFSSRT